MKLVRKKRNSYLICNANDIEIIHAIAILIYPIKDPKITIRLGHPNQMLHSNMVMIVTCGILELWAK